MTVRNERPQVNKTVQHSGVIKAASLIVIISIILSIFRNLRWFIGI